MSSSGLHKAIPSPSWPGCDGEPFSPRIIDQLFEDVAQRQYTRDLLFSSIVELMSVVVCRIQPSIDATYQKKAVPISVSLQALYRKIIRIETPIASALVRKSDERLAPVIIAMGGSLTPFLPGYRTKILDGNHLPGTEHRIQELRTMRAGALPGHALVVFDPERMLAITPSSARTAMPRSGRCWIRSFRPSRRGTCGSRTATSATTRLSLRDRPPRRFLRHPSARLDAALHARRQAEGPEEWIETGAVFEQALLVTNEAGEILFPARCVSVALDEPTRDGDTEIHLFVTNLPARGVDARRELPIFTAWKMDDRDPAFQELEATLWGEISTLGYPKACSFAFCVALVSDNVLSTVKAASRAAHGADQIT